MNYDTNVRKQDKKLVLLIFLKTYKNVDTYSNISWNV